MIGLKQILLLWFITIIGSILAAYHLFYGVIVVAILLCVIDIILGLTYAGIKGKINAHKFIKGIIIKHLEIALAFIGFAFRVTTNPESPFFHFKEYYKVPLGVITATLIIYTESKSIFLLVRKLYTYSYQKRKKKILTS